jgi:hypothetical protein
MKTIAAASYAQQVFCVASILSFGYFRIERSCCIERSINSHAESVPFTHFPLMPMHIPPTS